MAQNVFINGLTREVQRRTNNISAHAVIEAGPTNLKALTSSKEVLDTLREAYAGAVKNTLCYALVTACLAVPFALNMEWKNMKQVAKQRGERKEDRPSIDKETIQ